MKNESSKINIGIFNRLLKLQKADEKYKIGGKISVYASNRKIQRGPFFLRF